MKATAVADQHRPAAAVVLLLSHIARAGRVGNCTRGFAGQDVSRCTCFGRRLQQRGWGCLLGLLLASDTPVAHPERPGLWLAPAAGDVLGTLQCCLRGRRLDLGWKMLVPRAAVMQLAHGHTPAPWITATTVHELHARAATHLLAVPHRAATPTLAVVGNNNSNLN